MRYGREHQRASRLIRARRNVSRVVAPWETELSQRFSLLKRLINRAGWAWSSRRSEVAEPPFSRQRPQHNGRLTWSVLHARARARAAIPRIKLFGQCTIIERRFVTWAACKPRASRRRETGPETRPGILCARDSGKLLRALLSTSWSIAIRNSRPSRVTWRSPHSGVRQKCS